MHHNMVLVERNMSASGEVSIALSFIEQINLQAFTIAQHISATGLMIASLEWHY